MATVLTIVNYYRKTFLVQATAYKSLFKNIFGISYINARHIALANADVGIN
jgi:hypothetical protein